MAQDAVIVLRIRGVTRAQWDILKTTIKTFITNNPSIIIEQMHYQETD